MRQLSVVQAESGVVVASRVAVADSFARRLRGLLGRPPMEQEEGLLLLDCESIHTAGMRYPIDVAFLDADRQVVRSISALRPWRIGLGGSSAVHALELPAGRLRRTGTVPGVRLSWS